MQGEERAVLVVVVNYRTSEMLARLIQSLLGEPEVVEIVVRDNSSGSDAAGLKDLVRRFPTVRVLEGGNIGFGGGVNAAVRQADSGWTHLWVLNPDAAVRSGAAATLLAACSDHGWGVVSPLILTPRPGGDAIWYAGGELDLVRGRATHGGAGRPYVRAGTARQVTFITGAAPLLTREAWERLGGFSEHYFLYWEDADLSKRAAELGVELGFEPAAVVDHWQGGASGGAASPVYCFYVQRNRLWLTPSRLRRLDLAFGRGARITAQYLLQPLRRSTASATPLRSTIASFRGLIAGLRGPGGRRAAAPSAG